MPPKIPIIDTDEIGKKIGLSLYQIADKKGISQTEIAEKLWVTTPSISFLLTGKKATWNLEQYRKIAEAIPISRQEFDQIVETAKSEVLWIGQNSWTKINRDMAISFLANSDDVSPEDIEFAINIVKAQKNRK